MSVLERAVVLSKGQQRFLNGVLVPKVAEHFSSIDPMFGQFDKTEWKQYLWNRFACPCGDYSIQSMVDWCDGLDIDLYNP